MNKTLEKYWLVISAIILLFILAAFLLWPAVTQPLSGILIIAGLGIAIIFSIRRHLQSIQQGKISRNAAIRNIIIETLGILLSVAAAVWLTGKAASWIVPIIAYAAEAARPGMGLPAGILAGLLVALCIGLGVGFLMRWGWSKLVKSAV